MSEIGFSLGDIVDFKVPKSSSYEIVDIKDGKLQLRMFNIANVDPANVVHLKSDDSDPQYLVEVGIPASKFHIGDMVYLQPDETFDAEIVLRLYDYGEKTWKYIYRFDDLSMGMISEEYLVKTNPDALL